MHNWHALVRERLGHLHVPPEREVEIVAELAQQLEQAYADAIAAGLADPGARRRLMALESGRVEQPEIVPWPSAADFYDFRERAHSFSAIAAISPLWNVVLTGRGEAEQLDALYVSAEFFAMLGVNAAPGRVFT